MKKVRVLSGWGYGVAVGELLLLVGYLLTLLCSPAGGAALVLLIATAPFWLLGIAGVYFIGRIGVLPGVYSALAGLETGWIYRLVSPNVKLIFPRLTGVLVIVCVIGWLLLSAACWLWGRRIGTANRRWIAVGLIAAVVLLLLAAFFLIVVRIITQTPSGGAAPPLSTLPGALSVFGMCL